MAKIVSPVLASFISSEYGLRNGYLHAGMDMATGQESRVVRAAYAGRLSNIVRNRVHDRSANQVLNQGKKVVAPGRTGNGNRVNNPDGETQAYIHVLVDEKWEDGDWIEAGERLGVTDLSGNTSGYHLHFEIWNASGTTRNPRLDFVFHGVVPGSKPVVPKPPAPKPKPKPKPKPEPGLSTADVKAIQRALIEMGYDVGPAGADGKYESLTEKAVGAYQTDLNYFAGAGLVVDKDWGPVLQGWYDWVKQLQRALPAWQGVPKLRVDGGYQALTANAVKILQSRNGLHPDGKAQIKTTTFMRKHGSNVPNPPKNRP